MRLHTEVLKPDISTFACRVISLFGVMDPLLETARNIGFVGSLEFRSEQQPEPKPSLIQPIPHSQAIACVESSQLSVPPVTARSRGYPWYRVGCFQTICLTYMARRINTSAERALVEAGSAGILDLEEALEPPDLEDALADDDAHLEDAPPLDAGVGALGGVAVGALADDDVALLVFDLGEEFGKLLDCWWDLLASGYCGLYVQGFMDSTYPPSPADLGEPRSRARRRCRAR